MTHNQRWRVLIPVRLIEGETLPPSLIESLESVDTVILGYHVTKDQVTPEHARQEFGERANQAMDDLVDEFTSAGRTVETRLVFTPDHERTIDRVAGSSDINVILYPGPLRDVNRVLVATRGLVGSKRIAAFVASIFGKSGCHISLLHVVPNRSKVDEGEKYLEAVVNDIQQNIEVSRDVDRQVMVNQSPLVAILEEAANCDLVVIGESHDSWRNVLFGNLSENIRNRVDKPVFIVRQQ